MMIRRWLRAVLGAGGLALLVPVGLGLAVVLAAAVGGTSVGGLGQLLDGPGIPGAAAAPVVATVPEIPARPTARPAGGATATGRGSGATASPPPRTPASRRATPRRPTTPARPGTAAREPATSAAPPVPPVPAPAASVPAPAAPAPSSPVRQVGGAVQDAVRPVAPPVADAVGTLTDLLAPR